MADSKTPLEADRFYHIYNHAVGNELLFYRNENYLLFLRLIQKYLINYFDFHAYCLMPNHFHLVVQVKNPNENNFYDYKGNKPEELYYFLSRKLSHLFNSYAQSINKQQNRKGSLFYNRYKRQQITSESYLKKLIHYVHYNPVKARLCNDISDWIFSSYNAYLTSSKSLIKRDYVIDLYGDLSNFIYCHKTIPEISGL
ncbi:MAG: transposase [Salinivirgaceae bacterium]